MLRTMIPESVERICRAVADAGGRALVVGGFVRDVLLGCPSKDIDIEVYGLSLEDLEGVLRGFGSVSAVGRVFGVLRVHGLDVDFSLPRRDSKVRPGHRGFEVVCEPELSYAEAARRRDLTINSMALDPLTDEVLDPHGGQADLKAGCLRATDPDCFAEDPLRGLRAAQFSARLLMRPDPSLVELCRQLDLSELSAERLWGEFHKLLLKGRRPSWGLEFLAETSLLRFFPELNALQGVPQDARWHPEGDVWVHTLMALDVAVGLKRGDGEDVALMFGVLCHDFGKATHTQIEADGVRSRGHDVAGVEPARAFLKRLRAPQRLEAQVAALTQHHLAPALLGDQGAGAKAYRRLARKLGAADVSLELLYRVACADYWGRTTEDAKARRFSAGAAFLEQARRADVIQSATPDVVLGRHLIARGFKPGADFGAILATCREIQDETGWTSANRILDAALEKAPRSES